MTFKWKYLLGIVPAGLLVGLLGAMVVDPEMEFSGQSGIGGKGERVAERRALPEPDLYAESEEEEDELDDLFAERPGSFRPDLDYDEEIWDQDLADLRWDSPSRDSDYGGPTAPEYPVEPPAPSDRYASVPRDRPQPAPAPPPVPQDGDDLPAIY